MLSWWRIELQSVDRISANCWYAPPPRLSIGFVSVQPKLRPTLSLSFYWRWKLLFIFSLKRLQKSWNQPAVNYRNVIAANWKGICEKWILDAIFRWFIWWIDLDRLANGRHALLHAFGWYNPWWMGMLLYALVILSLRNLFTLSGYFEWWLSAVLSSNNLACYFYDGYNKTWLAVKSPVSTIIYRYSLDSDTFIYCAFMSSIASYLSKGLLLLVDTPPCTSNEPAVDSSVQRPDPLDERKTVGSGGQSPVSSDSEDTLLIVAPTPTPRNSLSKMPDSLRPLISQLPGERPMKPEPISLSLSSNDTTYQPNPTPPDRSPVVGSRRFVDGDHVLDRSAHGSANDHEEPEYESSIPLQPPVPPKSRDYFSSSNILSCGATKDMVCCHCISIWFFWNIIVLLYLC